MKTKDELTALKNEVDTLNAKLAELSEDELAEVTGGLIPNIPPQRMNDTVYTNMFDGCPGLKPAPDLPATQIADDPFSVQG